MRFWFPSTITDIVSQNDSFDSCMMRVCYVGANRNGSFFTKEVLERAIPSMSYCPIVAHYDAHTDAIGGHDVEFIKDTNDVMHMVNLTEGIGVIPQDPQYYWESVTEEDGTVHDYLCVPALLWKRSAAYSKIKRDGIEGQSMEIDVYDGKREDGYYHIYDFAFTAFCVLGEDVTPCFESASVASYSLNEVKESIANMMEDLKHEFCMTASANAVDDKNNLKGGDVSLNIAEIMNEYGLVQEDVDFDMTGMSEEELRNKFSAIVELKNADQHPIEQFASDEGSDENGTSDTHDSEEHEQFAQEENENNTYSLTAEQMSSEVRDALRQVVYNDPYFGDCPRYWYVDHDAEKGEIYAVDMADSKLYGFVFTMNGDNVVIDFECKKRKKCSYVDFEEGDVVTSYQYFADELSAHCSAMQEEVAALREYKAAVELEKRHGEEAKIFSNFPDLANDEAFIALSENCSDMSLQEIEDKCFAMRGRMVHAKFSEDTGAQAVRTPVEHTGDAYDGEPYGGIYVKYRNH